MVHNVISQILNQSQSQYHQMLKLVSPTITPPLTSICNCSFNTSTFSSYCKKALINPLLKTMTPLTISDTRPIAILPELSKILEREAFNYLLDFLETYELLDQRQARYRHGHSTETVLIAVTDDIRYAIEKSNNPDTF